MSEQRTPPGQIAARIARDLGAPELVDKLIALPQNELTSLLLEVFRRRSERRTPGDLLAQYERGGACPPSNTDARLVGAVEAHAFAAAAAFEAVALSPVAPLGVNAVLGDIDQNSTLAALRALEVLGDPTTVMALESAQRRKRQPDAEVRLCAAARMLRMQPFDNPAFSRHFAIFALTTAGRDRGSGAFELEALGEQLRVHVGFLMRLAADGYRFADVRVEIADTARDRAGERRLAAVEAQLFPSLRAEFPGVTFAFDPARTHAMSYYRGLCLHVGARDVRGDVQLIGDGGFTDWTERLLSNGKERLLVSGFGSELLPRCFR
jgi:hypothetical protein